MSDNNHYDTSVTKNSSDDRVGVCISRSDSGEISGIYDDMSTKLETPVKSPPDRETRETPRSFLGNETPRSFYRKKMNSMFNLSIGDDCVDAPRLIERNLGFHQSKNVFNVKNKHGATRWKWIWFLMTRDPFHVLLRLPTLLSVFLLCVLWTIVILFFAAIYIEADRRNPDVNCGLSVEGDGTPLRYYTAFAFSLETSTTVGYGLPAGSAFFQNCPSVQVSVYFQQIFSMIFNAFLLAFLFARFSRCESRSHQVLFTNKAILRKDKRGRFVFEVKLYDVDSKFPLVEAHVRMYLVHYCQNRNYIPLRILRPNDDLGATLCSSIPTVISHHIDAYSAMTPPKFRKKTNCIDDQNSLVLREIDSYVGNRDGVPCPVCGEVFGTTERLLKHIRYNRLTEKHDAVPVEGSHQELTDEDLKHLASSSQNQPDLTYDEFRKFWEKNKMEVIVMFEAIGPLSSGTFQALQSYQKEDICYGGKFAPIFTKDNEVDLQSFHKILEDEEESFFYK